MKRQCSWMQCSWRMWMASSWCSMYVAIELQRQWPRVYVCFDYSSLFFVRPRVLIFRSRCQSQWCPATRRSEDCHTVSASRSASGYARLPELREKQNQWVSRGFGKIEAKRKPYRRVLCIPLRPLRDFVTTSSCIFSSMLSFWAMNATVWPSSTS